MADSKSTQPRPAEGAPLSAQAGDSSSSAERIKAMEAALTDADSCMQDAHDTTEAALASIRLILMEPDTGGNRETIYRLCEIIEYHSFSAMNAVNSAAEVFGANHIDERKHDAMSRMYDAARKGRANGTEAAS